MSLYLDLFTMIFSTAGLMFFIAGSVGLWRFNDIYSRLHALTKVDNLGLGLIILAVIPQVATLADAIQLLLIWFVALIASAVCCYLLASTQLIDHCGDGQIQIKTPFTPEETPNA